MSVSVSIFLFQSIWREVCLCAAANKYVCDSCLVICMNCTKIISGTDEQKFLRSALASVFLVVLTHMPLESARCGLLA